MAAISSSVRLLATNLKNGVVLHVKGVLHVRVVLHWRRVVLDIHRRDYTVMMGRTIGIYRLARCLWARLKCR